MTDKNNIIVMIHDGEKSSINIPSCDEEQFNILIEKLANHNFTITEEKENITRGYRNPGFFGTDPAIVIQILKQNDGILFELSLRITLSFYILLSLAMYALFNYLIFKYLLSSSLQSLVLFLIFQIIIVYISLFIRSLIFRTEKMRLNYDISKNAEWNMMASRVKWNELITFDLKNIFNNKIIQKDIAPQTETTLNKKTKKILYKIGIIIFLFPMISSILAKILLTPYQVILELISPGLINTTFGKFLMIFLGIWVLVSTFFISRKIWRKVDED